MGSLRYWMIFQVVVGIWLAASPYILGYGEISTMTINNIIVGGIMAILGLVFAFTGLPEIRHPEKKTT